MNQSIFNSFIKNWTLKIFTEEYYPEADHFIARSFSRRRFLRNMSMLVSLYFIPLSSCTGLFKRHNRNLRNYRLSKSEMEILQAVQLHILPATEDGPDAIDINAPEYFQFIVSDKNLYAIKRRILIQGISWVQETSDEMYSKDFTSLTEEERESVLRDLESFKNGRRWLSWVMNYILEALLGSPAYQINRNRVGWDWLEHIPGQPQPLADKIYGTYGYGL